MFPIFEWLAAQAQSSTAQEVLQSVFGMSLREAQRLYGSAFDDPLQMPDREYPELKNLRSWNLRAVSCMFQVDTAYIGEMLARATAGFDEVSKDLYRARNGRRFINIDTSPQFAGTMVSLLTNDLSVFDRIEAGHYSPPPPWLVFPEHDPDTLGSLQGDIEYWWYTYWSPYWRRLSESEQVQYLKHHQASDAWAECVLCH